MVFCLWPWNKATEFWMGWWDIPLTEETEIRKILHQDHVDNFFQLSRHSAQRICSRGKTVNAEFYKGVTDHLLKWFNSCVLPSRLFLLQDNAPTHKAASVCQFLTQKNFATLYHPPPVLSRFISTRLLSIPQVENEVKRTPLRRCCWNPRSHNWWIKEGIFGSFSETVRLHKSLCVWQWRLFQNKKVWVFLMCLRF